VIERLVAIVLAPASPFASVTATVVRLAAGAILIGFGQSKFAHHAREVRAFDRYGLPAPEVFTYAIGTVELGGGVLLVLGLVTRLVALGLVGNMVGAIATGGRVDGGFVNLGLAPLLLVAMLFLVWAGAGRLSMDEHWAAASAYVRLWTNRHAFVTHLRQTRDDFTVTIESGWWAGVPRPIGEICGQFPGGPSRRRAARRPSLGRGLFRACAARRVVAREPEQ
jgi:putative oxidoreductase